MPSNSDKYQKLNNLLVIDDDPEVVSFLTETLASKGYRVSGETEPERVLARLETESFDLLLSDVEMPGLRGVDLMRHVHAKNPNQLILLMTAFGSIDLSVRSMQAGACGFVIKPFSIDELLSAIERAFADRAMRREIIRVSMPGSLGNCDGLVAESPNMIKIVQLAQRSAAVNLPV